MSADEPGSQRVFGNNIAILGTSLHSQIDDPLARFNATQESTLAGKRYLHVLGKTTLPSITHYLLPAMVRVPRQREYRLKLADSGDYKYPCQVTVSNVPGPRQQLETDQAVLESLYSVGPLQEGNGLNITVWSYMDQLNVSALACHRAMPDLERLTGYIPEAFRELQAADAAAL